MYEGTLTLRRGAGRRGSEAINDRSSYRRATTADSQSSHFAKGTFHGQVQVEDIRNIVFCGHGSAGKTTLVDKILTTTGAVNRPASVDDGTSICDFDEEEKHHKYTIEVDASCISTTAASTST